LTAPRQRLPKTAAELIPGSLKRAKSYAEELAQFTQETLEQIARDRASPLREKARSMLKLIKQSERLLEKVGQKGGSA
jgi:ERCC4-type nuclease